MPAWFNLASEGRERVRERRSGLGCLGEGGERTGCIRSVCSRPIASVLMQLSAVGSNFFTRQRHTRQFLLIVFVVFVAVAVRGYICAGFGVANVLHLV